MTQPTPQEIEDRAFREAGRLLFAGEAGFFWASSDIKNLPPMKGVEIAFAGRSNVGKSSLVNALTGRKTLARTSNTPGRTQQLNFFHVGEELAIIDMPGYGFAAVGKKKVAAWTGLIHDYLRGRVNLARVFLLIDSRHGIKDTDLPVLETLDVSAVSYQVVLTKVDAITPDQLQARVAETLALLKKHPAAFPEIITTSSKESLGVEELRGVIAKLLHQQTKK